MLATKISFMNEIAHLCAVAGGDVEQVRIALGSDPRIGYPFLYAGLGFGGSCFPKDLRALVRTGRDLGVPLSIAAAAIEANQRPVGRLVEELDHDLGGLSGKTIAIWGLAFKPRTDDVRDAPALGLIARLVGRGATVRATDPQAVETAARELGRRGVVGVELMTDEYEACRGADALVVATEWNEYRSPDFDRIRELMRGRYVFDGRNVLVPGIVADAGFRYRGVGRPVVDPRARATSQ
jgi:UDPglucose 6-dehydrogenase